MTRDKTKKPSCWMFGTPPLHCAGRRSRSMEWQESPSMNGTIDTEVRSPIMVAVVSQPLLSRTPLTATISSFLRTTTPLLVRLCSFLPIRTSIHPRFLSHNTPPVGPSHHYPTRSQLTIFPIALPLRRTHFLALLAAKSLLLPSPARCFYSPFLQ